jgi:hypothetical protein
MLVNFLCKKKNKKRENKEKHVDSIQLNIRRLNFLLLLQKVVFSNVINCLWYYNFLSCLKLPGNYEESGVSGLKY